MFRRILKLLLAMSVALVVSIIPMACNGGGQSAAPTSIAGVLSTTMVPNVDLDVYVYINQGTPTRIPRSLLGTPNDIMVESLAVWGIVKDDGYSLSGALTFASASDASIIGSHITQQPGIWTEQSGRNIYFVQGNGTEADAMKSAISKNNFKPYNDGQALTEVSNMPAGGITKPAGFAIIRPSQAMINLIKKFTGQNNASVVQNAFDGAKPQVVVVGLYSSEPIDIADIMQKAANNTLWSSNLGILGSVNSLYPGVVFGPIATKQLDDQNFSKEIIGNLTVYKVPVSAGESKTIPLLVNVDGNHVFAAVSGNESYAGTLLAGIKR